MLIEQPQRGRASKIICFGRHSYGLNHLKIHSWNEGCNLYIGSFNSVGKNVSVLLGGNHSTTWTSTYPFGHIKQEIFSPGPLSNLHPFSKGHTIIYNDVWLGQQSTILSGIKLHSGSVVAAYAVVTRDVPPYSIVAGNPARVVKKRFSDDLIALLLKLRWWDQSDIVINKLVPLLQEEPTYESIQKMYDIISNSPVPQ